MPQTEHELRILETLERNPTITQANLAAQLGVAVGSVNWYLKRMVHKGYVKVSQLERRKLKYFVTPKGLAVKAQLTSKYMEASLRVYRELREAAKETLDQIQQRGYNTIVVNGAGEAIEIFRLSCLEKGLQVTRTDDTLPAVRSEGTAFAVEWPEE